MQLLEQLIGTQAGLLIAFMATATLVVLTGIKLSIFGDALGDRTGLGNGLIGLVFLAGVTSLPELVVSLTSVLNAVEPNQGADLAVGNMLGSNVFNLLILAFIPLLFPKKFKPQDMENSHTDSTFYGLLMLGIFSIAFLVNPVSIIPAVNSSWLTFILPIAYGVVLVREHRQHQNLNDPHLPEETRLTQLSTIHFYSILLGLCGLIIAGGIVLSILGSRMSLAPEQGGFGLEASLIGTIFLAISTSLPELVISFASVRMGFLDMAVGNVLGSNMFNLLIVFVADVAMRGSSLMSHASQKHWTSVSLILLLTLMARALLSSKSRKTALPTALGMLICYIAAMIFMV
ncbi:MAG TPA: hypothetical protein VIR63_06955 [Pontiella sp.]